MPAILTSVLGALLALFAIREMFHDLFHPARGGAFSDFVARSVFVLCRKHGPILPLAGSLSVVIVLFSWTLMLGLGFALIYYGSYPEAFQTATGGAAPSEPRFRLSLYIGLQALTGLFGDLTPTPPWLRILISLQSLLGFALMTASVSWIVLLYPPLTRMRALARDVAVIVDAERQTGIAVTAGDSEQMLAHLAGQLVRTRIDLVHFPILYYFHPDEESASLGRAIPHLVRFADEAAGRREERVLAK